MKKHFWIVVLVAVAVSLTPQAALAVTPSASNGAQAAFGAGHYTVGTSSDSIIFFAYKSMDGNVAGALRFQQLPYTYYGRLDCLATVAGYAFVSGVITQSNDPLVPSGSSVVFAVRDIDLSGRSADQISQIDFRFDEPCTTFHEQPVHSLDRGAFEVR